jgi:hypothetical protein
MISPILNSSLQGVLRGMERMDNTANEIARAGKGGNMDLNSFTTNLVDLKTQEQDIKANMKMIKVADGVLGSLLDERA